MASKLIELRQRMRGYQPVRTGEDEEVDFDASSASDSDASAAGPHPSRRQRARRAGGGAAGTRRAGGASIDSMELNFDDFPDAAEAPSTWRRLARQLGFDSSSSSSSGSSSGSAGGSSGGGRGGSGGGSNNIGVPMRSSSETNTCVYVVLGLALSGILFLSVIAYMLDSDYEYIKIPGGKQKMSLSGGVYGAIYMYVLTAICCVYLIISKGPSTGHS